MKNLYMLTAMVLAAAGCGVDAERSSSSLARALLPEPDRVVSLVSPEGRAAYPVGVTAVLRRTDLIVDREGDGLNADPGIANAWGFAFSPNGADVWVTGNGAGSLSNYKSTGALFSRVAVPARDGESTAATVTGLVFNANPQAFYGDTLVFVTDDGAVAGWQPAYGLTAKRRAESGANPSLYTSLALEYAHHEARLFAVNLRQGTIDVFDSAYRPITVGGGFRDANMPVDYSPYNVVAFNGVLVVTYAKRSPEGVDVVPGAGHGYVNVFDPEGTLFQRLISRGALDAPSGLALAPEGFGGLTDRLLVGNYGDGRINTYKIGIANDRLIAVFDGPLYDTTLRPLVIERLRGLAFGPGGLFATNRLYFTAGASDGSHGEFGYLSTR